jgi:hypothetical protein
LRSVKHTLAAARARKGTSSEFCQSLKITSIIRSNIFKRLLQQLLALRTGLVRSSFLTIPQSLIFSRTGKYRRDRQTVVLNHYKAIRTDDPATYTYDCQCGEYDGTQEENEIFGTFLCRLSFLKFLSDPLTSLCKHGYTQGRQSLRSILGG